eukprot:g20805.t1
MEVGGVLPPSPTGTCSMVADAKHLGGKRAEPAETAVTSGPRCRITCKDFPFCTAHCPFLFCILVFSAMPLVLALLWPGIVVNSDTSVFLEADSRSSTIRTAFLGRVPWTRRDVSRGSEAEHPLDLREFPPELLTMPMPATPGALPFRDASSRDRRLMTGPMPPIDLNDMYKMDQLNLYYRALGSPGLLASDPWDWRNARHARDWRNRSRSSDSLSWIFARAPSINESVTSSRRLAWALAAIQEGRQEGSMH